MATASTEAEEAVNDGRIRTGVPGFAGVPNSGGSHKPSCSSNVGERVGERTAQAKRHWLALGSALSLKLEAAFQRGVTEPFHIHVHQRDYRVLLDPMVLVSSVLMA